MWIGRLLLPAILILVSSCWANDDSEVKSPLILKGKLTSIDLVSNESYRLTYQAHFDLDVVNVSNENILLMRRDPVVVDSSSAQWTPEGEVTFDVRERKKVLLHSALDHEAPPEELIILLKPGESYTTHTTIPLDFYPPSADRPKEPFYPKSKAAKLELNLANSPFDIYYDQEKNKNKGKDEDEEKNKDKDENADDYDSFNKSEFQEGLQKRWAKTGKLYLEQIESEPIEIPLPEPPALRKHSGLAVRGHVDSVYLIEETSTAISFNVELDLKFVNTGDRPVILLRPEAEGLFLPWDDGLSVEGVGISESRKAMEMGTYIHRDGQWKSVSGDPAFKLLQAALDQPQPPEYLVWIIPPESATSSYHTSKRVSFSKAQNSLDIMPPETINRLWEVISKAPKLWMNLDVEIWSSEIERSVIADSPNFARTLRQRWAAIGELELGENGVVTSEPIELTIPLQYRQTARTLEEVAQNQQ